MTDSQLPAEHGTSIIYRCSPKHAKRGGNVDLVCEDGKITFTSGATPCFKIGTVLNLVYDRNLFTRNVRTGSPKGMVEAIVTFD